MKKCLVGPVFCICTLVLCASGFIAAAEPLTLDLAKVLEMTEVRNVDVLVSKDRVAQSLDRLEETRAALKPQLTGTASQARRTVNLKAQGIPLPGDPLIGPFNSFDARVRLTQTLFDLGAIDRLRQARAGKTLSEAEALKARQDAQALVGSLFVDARRASQTEVLAATRLRREEQAESLASLRLKNGTGSALDAQDAQSRLASAQQALAAARSEARSTRLDLLAALDLPLDQPIVFSDSQSSGSAIPLSATDAKGAVMAHPDVLAAEESLKAKTLETTALRSDSWPRVSASADYGASGVTPTDSLGTYQISGQLSVPIYEGGYRGARVKDAEHARAESEKRLADVRRKTEAKALAADDALKDCATRVFTTRADREVADAQWALAKRRLDNGSGSAIEALDGEVLSAQSHDREADAIAGYDLARIRWARALGKMELLKERTQ